MTTNLAQTTVRGTFWTYAAYYSGKLIVFFSTLVLIRLLTKDDFGVVGYATTILSFVDVLHDMGIPPAIVFHRNDPEVADTAFWLMMATSLTLFVITWFGLGPLTGWYFKDPRAVPVTIVMAITYPLGALGTVHESLLTKNLRFSLSFIPDFVQSLSKGILSILFALLGWGPWSLVLGPIGSTLLGVIVNWWIWPWRPRFRFVWPIARNLLSYGLHTVAVNMVGLLVLNVDYLLVGRFLGAEVLGTYTIAFRIPELLILQFCYIIARVIFPVYTKLREEPGALARGFLETIRFVPMITIPMGLGLALVAGPFVHTIFPPNWTETIPVIQFIALYALMLSLSYNAGDVYKAQGRPMLLTWLAGLRLLILAPALWYAVVHYRTIVAVGGVQVVVAFLGGLLNLVVASRMLNTPFRQVAYALLPSLLGGGVMSVMVGGALLVLSGAPAPVQLIVGVAVGMTSYVSALWLIQPQVMRQGLATLRAALPGK
jgi:O-antigen/teichoic acid export membrane protein